MSEEKKPLNAENDKKAPKEENEEEEGGCTKCWNGYCACIVAICKVNLILFKKDKMYNLILINR